MLVTAERYRKHNPNPGTQSETELDTVLDVAEQTIRCQTCGKLDHFDSFSAERQELIRKAILFQADYLLANGGTDFLGGAVPESATIGSFSYTIGSNQSGGSELRLCGAARTYLMSAGLLYRGDIGVC